MPYILNDFKEFVDIFYTANVSCKKNKFDVCELASHIDKMTVATQTAPLQMLWCAGTALFVFNVQEYSFWMSSQ